MSGQNRWIQVGAIFVILILATALFGTILKNNPQNLGVTVVLSVIAITAGVMVLAPYFQPRLDEATLLKQRQTQLVQEAGSQVGYQALAAIKQLRDQGWLTGDTGLLAGAYLVQADLQKADLTDANLYRAKLESANLQGADLTSANLDDADLEGANLQGARVVDASLRAVNLQEANLQGADLTGATLENADLGHDNGYPTIFDQSTILPDGSRWTPETDMTRFTKAILGE
ncbi:MAG TPA: pentapeptide repeat-containing protein [Phototrophicaceae bacterium]|jgi:hypothetical protein|nr:pentapeptide repeat-containing protein [Phototrophicaceae bacterium]